MSFIKTDFNRWKDEDESESDTEDAGGNDSLNAVRGLLSQSVSIAHVVCKYWRVLSFAWLARPDMTAQGGVLITRYLVTITR